MFHPDGPTLYQLACQALSSTERGYDLLATKFDYTPFRTADVFFSAFNARLCPEGHEYEFRDVLDVCCGTGAGMQAIAPFCTERLVGIDMSQGMLDQAGMNLSGIQNVNKELVRGDAYSMPFDNEFDLAICFGAFGHVLPVDEQKFVDQIFNSLKPGGCFAFITHEMPSVISIGYWMARGFNGVMRVRNLLIRPPFIMYYLTFLWPTVRAKLETAGFSVQSEPLFPDEPKLKLFRFVKAIKPLENPSL